MSQETKSIPQSGGTTVFILAVFLSAFLLFQVQPIIARYILPWFGGSSSVWTTCMLFFQLGLVVGYAYAHLLVTIFRDRRSLQIGLHFLLLTIAVITMPITPDPEMRPGPGDTRPVWGILLLLTKTVGIPYVVLSASGPLVQHWFSKVYPGRSPFRLYAVSNAGSLLALLSYPFLVEVYLSVSRQSILWSVGFAGYAVVLLATSFVFMKSRTRSSAIEEESPAKGGGASPPSHYLRWILFSACGSILLLSVTNQICQDVAVVPFLWVLPLSLYLLSFIIAFDHSRWYFRLLVIPVTAIAVGLAVILLNEYFDSWAWSYVWQIVIYGGALFFSCLVCHGEIVRLKPEASRLTGFYLAISIGGALGGLFVSFVAPQIFESYYEVQVGIVLLAILVTWQLFPKLVGVFRTFSRGSENPSTTGFILAGLGGVAWCAALCALVIGFYSHASKEKEGVISSSRGFFGVLKVREKVAETGQVYRILAHGQIDHGLQFVGSKLAKYPTTYFGKETGIGSTFEFMPRRFKREASPLNVGVIGLGVGTLAAYAREGDHFKFYEINPQVIELAKSHFTYLKDCRGDLEVVLGDGRISLERELLHEGGSKFDILVIDAFSGDSIPMHLLTMEAFDLYLSHLKQDGVLAMHITNRHVDLSDPLRLFARKRGWQAFRLTINSSDGIMYANNWVIITRNRPLVEELFRARRIYEWSRKEPKNLFWTDDFHNLLRALKD